MHSWVVQMLEPDLQHNEDHTEIHSRMLHGLFFVQKNEKGR